jgi:hypothetical protein
MFSRHLGFEITLLITVCALALFSVPVAQGPCILFHGPVTGLRSFRTKRKLLMAMARAAFGCAGRWIAASLTLMSLAPRSLSLPEFLPPEFLSILRC